MQESPPRGRGRPRVDIDLGAVTDVAARIFAERGYDAVSVESVAAELDVSRATLYRTVPTKNALLEVVFERNTAELLAAAGEVAAEENDPGEALRGLIRMHVDAAIRMGPYMTVFTQPASLGDAAAARWREWTHGYEELWGHAVERAMAAGVLHPGDVARTTRLLLGMLIWVSRWHNAGPGASADEIADTAIGLVCHDLADDN